MANKVSEKLHDAKLSPTVYQIYTGSANTVSSDPNITVMGIDIPCGGTISNSGSNDDVVQRWVDAFSDVAAEVFPHLPVDLSSVIGNYPVTPGENYELAFVAVSEVDVTFDNGYKGYGYAWRPIWKNMSDDESETLTYIWALFNTYYQTSTKYSYISGVGYGGVYYYAHTGTSSYEYQSGAGNLFTASYYSNVRTAINGNATNPNGKIYGTGYLLSMCPEAFYLYDENGDYIRTWAPSGSWSSSGTNNTRPNLIVATGGIRQPATDEWLEVSKNTYEGLHNTYNINGVSTTLTIKSVDGLYFSGLNFVEAEEPEEEDKDMFTSMVGLWDIDSDNLARLATALQNSVEQNDPILNSIVGLRIIKNPNVDWSEESDTSKVFDFVQLNGISSTINAKKLNNQFKAFTLGTYSFEEHFKNFLDYPPYTKCYLYLPFIGVTELDGNLVMGRSIRIQCSVDAYSGDITYEVRHGDSETSGLPISTYTANCSIELPIVSRVNQSYKESLAIMSTALNTTIAVGNNMMGGLNVGGAIASGTATAAQGALDIYQTYASGGYNDIKAERGNLNASHGWNGYGQPFVMIIRPKDGADDNYKNANGQPLMQNKTLSSCSGFTQCINPELTGINGTEEELNAIKSQLQSGIII